jgi:hypothetical protein
VLSELQSKLWQSKSLDIMLPSQNIKLWQQKWDSQKNTFNNAFNNDPQIQEPTVTQSALKKKKMTAQDLFSLLKCWKKIYEYYNLHSVTMAPSHTTHTVKTH